MNPIKKIRLRRQKREQERLNSQSQKEVENLEEDLDSHVDEEDLSSEEEMKDTVPDEIVRPRKERPLGRRRS